MTSRAKNKKHEQPAKPPIIGPGHTFGSITDKISSIVLRKSRFPLLRGAVFTPAYGMS